MNIILNQCKDMKVCATSFIVCSKSANKKDHVLSKTFSFIYFFFLYFEILLFEVLLTTLPDPKISSPTYKIN